MKPEEIRRSTNTLSLRWKTKGIFVKNSIRERKGRTPGYLHCSTPRANLSFVHWMLDQDLFRVPVTFADLLVSLTHNQHILRACVAGKSSNDTSTAQTSSHVQNDAPTPFGNDTIIFIIMIPYPSPVPQAPTSTGTSLMISTCTPSTFIWPGFPNLSTTTQTPPVLHILGSTSMSCVRTPV